MKIIYSAGRRLGAGLQLERFLKSEPKVDLKIAAYNLSSSNLSHINWCLDSLHNQKPVNTQDLAKLFGHSNLPKMDVALAEVLFDEVSSFEPDLIISDGEPILAHIAHSLKIQLWYVSALHLLHAIKPQFSRCHYTAQLETTRKLLNRLPKANKTFIYSPFGGLGLKLKEGFEWIEPDIIDGAQSSNSAVVVFRDPEREEKILRIIQALDFSPSIFTGSSNNQYCYQSDAKWYFTTGETSFISDAMAIGARIAVAPNLKDPETLINAFLIQELGLGDDLLQVELLEKYSLMEIEKSYNKGPAQSYPNKQRFQTLKEKVEQYV